MVEVFTMLYQGVDLAMHDHDDDPADLTNLGVIGVSVHQEVDLSVLRDDDSTDLTNLGVIGVSVHQDTGKRRQSRSNKRC